MGTQEGNRGGKGGGPVLTSPRQSKGGLRNFSDQRGERSKKLYGSTKNLYGAR